MLSDGEKIAGYYAPDEDLDCSQHVPYLGDERDNFSREYRYIVASGFVRLREKMISFIEKNDLEPGVFISSRASVSPIAKYGSGFVAAPGATMNGNPVVGDYVFMNVQTNIGHHDEIGSNIVLSTGALINGHVTLGSRITCGANSTVIPGVSVCSDVELGAGCTVVRDITEAGVYVGTPAKRLNKNSR